MAMNKAEKARVEELENALRIAKAFRFTEPVPYDVLPPTGFGDDIVYGWSYNAYQGVTVKKTCSGTGLHGDGNGKLTSQRSISQHSTKLLALRAGRYEIEQMYARSLAGIDRLIEEELAK